MKKLESFGIAGINFTDRVLARGFTYTTREDELVPTNLCSKENPFQEEILSAKYILDVGCGIGRNLQWIMENTDAIYVGLDPNESMMQYFWDCQNLMWINRVQLHHNFDTIDKNIVFDVVVSTFVFQHIGYRPNESQMNITDITNSIRKFTKNGTVWFLIEHDGEEDWIPRWTSENGIIPDIYIRNYTGLEELTHRGLHHLIIWKE